MHPFAARLCVALDSGDRSWIVDMARQLGGRVGWLKLGLEAFASHGPELVRQLAGGPSRVFLDLKLHDIPATVAGASAAAARCGAAMLTVHAAGGPAMLRAALEGARAGAAGGSPPKVVAVTVLTSLDEEALDQLGLGDPAGLVLRWARMARAAGADGVVASPREAERLRASLGPDALIVTPGIRLAGDDRQDQRRVAEPAAAVAAGADILVVGRPITRADQPLAAVQRLLDAATQPT